jgi:hydroxyacylglutathione hydrolase
MRIVPIKQGFSSFLILIDQKPILIDTGMAGDVDKKIDAITKVGVKPKDISLILITHAHIDHVGNADDLRRITGAPIAMHKLDAEYSVKGLTAPAPPYSTTGKIMDFIFKSRKISPLPKLVPDILIDGDFDLNPYGVDARVISTPGHTPGSISVITSEYDAIVGDLMFGSFFNPNKLTMPYFMGDYDTWRKSVDLILSLNPRNIYAVHANPFKNEDIKRLLHLK